MKKCLIIGLLVVMLFASTQNVFARLGDPVKDFTNGTSGTTGTTGSTGPTLNTTPTLTNPYDDSTVNQSISKVSNRIWNTVANIVRMVAVGCLAFAGLRYMFASADQKADIKQGLIYLAIGSILIFGVTIVIEFVVKMFNEAV